MFNGKINYKWSFSIAMLNYQRVPVNLRKLIQKIDGLLGKISTGKHVFSYERAKGWGFLWHFTLNQSMGYFPWTKERCMANGIHAIWCRDLLGHSQTSRDCSQYCHLWWLGWKLLVCLRGVQSNWLSSRLLHSRTWVIKCPHWTSPNH